MIDISKVPLNMSVILAVSVCFLLMVLWNFHKDKDNQVDLKDLICHEGKISEAKFTRLGAFIVSTWGFIYLILDDGFSEWYFAGYMAAWVGNALFNKYLNSKETQSSNNQPLPRTTPPPPPPQLP